MPQENGSAVTLPSLRDTTFERLMVLRRRGLLFTSPVSGQYLLEWVPEIVLTMEVFLARANPNYAQEMGELKAGKRQTVLVFPVELGEWKIELGEWAEDGYIEASQDQGTEEDLNELPAYRDSLEGRSVTFEMLKVGPYWRVRGLLDGHEVWTRRYSSLPVTRYRITGKGRQAWAEAQAELSPQSDTPTEQSIGDEKVPLDERAVALLLKNPGWTTTKVAETLGCHRASLYDCPLFLKAREVQKLGREEHLPRGFRDKDTGQPVPVDE